ncbi:MAG TPA: redoxin domain-containing protein [Gemmataceae bacterium]|nr:redoxin domain-containing protein [Gemmataceae bacterium]
MVATLYLMGCVLAAGQTDGRPAPALRGDWLLAPRLSRSQELVYRGTFAEEAKGTRVEFSRNYHVEARVFVLDTPPRGAEVAFLTVLKHRGPAPAGPAVGAPPPATSVRLERAAVDLQGKVSADRAANLTVPLEGAPTLECGMFVEVPGGRVGANEPWGVLEPGRPARSWSVAGNEAVRGTACLKLVGVQQSDEWDRPRADRPAWRRQDTVWVAPRVGIAYKVERVIERREPAQDRPTQRSVLRYELDSGFQLTGRYADDCRQEIARALALRDKAAPLLPAPARYAPNLAALLKEIDYHVEHQPDTAYRPALLQVKRAVEAAKRGEAPPPALPAESAAPPAVAAVGRPAPDFLATELTGTGSARLRNLLGRPVLLVFYHPASPTAAEVLRFAQKVVADRGGAVRVVGMSVSDDAALVRKQHAEMKLTFPVLGGGGLRASYTIEDTPKFVLLDGAGVVRGAYLGWGRETAGEVLAELARWVAPPR